MGRSIRNMIAFCATLSFLVASLYCCCFSTIQWSQKHSCCQKKDSQNQKSSKHDCPHCNSSFNAEQTVDVHDIQLSSVAVTFAIEHKTQQAPVFIGKSLFIHGPPGSFHAVPLYIKNPSLRI